MKLVVLPLGQRALAGETIKFPVNVSEVYNSLPRPLNSDGVVLVKPLESTSATVSVDVVIKQQVLVVGLVMFYDNRERGERA